MAARFCGHGQPYEGLITGGRWNGAVRLVEEHLDDPLHWRRPRRIFVNSMSDLFHESLPDEMIDRVFAVIALAGAAHSFQILTKRAARMHRYMSAAARKERIFERVIDVAPVHPRHAERWIVDPLVRDHVKAAFPWPPPNAWLGVSVENQDAADTRIPVLLDTPAAVRWVSCEPLLGPIDLDPWIGCTCVDPQGCAGVAGGGCPGLHWVVVGGESGPGRRPMRPEWVRHLHEQCHDAGTAFFFKGWGAPAAPPLLDGLLHRQFPEVRRD